jgi:hypothetical protein
MLHESVADPTCVFHASEAVMVLALITFEETTTNKDFSSTRSMRYNQEAITCLDLGFAVAIFADNLREHTSCYSRTEFSHSLERNWYDNDLFLDTNLPLHLQGEMSLPSCSLP